MGPKQLHPSVHILAHLPKRLLSYGRPNGSPRRAILALFFFLSALWSHFDSTFSWFIQLFLQSAVLSPETTGNLLIVWLHCIYAPDWELSWRWLLITRAYIFFSVHCGAILTPLFSVFGGGILLVHSTFFLLSAVLSPETTGNLLIVWLHCIYAPDWELS